MIEADIRRATCRVTCGTEHGTGFMVTNSRVVTARHCISAAIESGTAVQLTFKELKGRGHCTVEAQVEAHDADLDACILSISALNDRPAVPLSADQVREGSQWFSFGFPISKPAVGHRLSGYVATVLPDPISKVDIDLAIAAESQMGSYSGLSGTPLIVSGECVGILRMRMDRTVAAISTRSLREFLTQNEIGFVSESRGQSASALADRGSFQKAFESRVLKDGGKYLFLEGPHGIGKTTFCDRYVSQNSTILHIGTYCVRELVERTNTVIRSKPEVLFDWILNTISLLLSGQEAREESLSYAKMADAMKSLLAQLSEFCQSRKKHGLIFIDGLNEAHDISPEVLSSFIGLLPVTMPPHVTVVLSAPNYSIVGSRLGGRVSVADVSSIPKLGDEACLAYGYNTLSDGVRSNSELVHKICEKANGHPLYLRYLIRYANANPDDTTLDAFPVLDKEIEEYYERLWLTLSQDATAINLVSIVSRLRAGLAIEDFVKILHAAEQAVFAASWVRINHLMSASDVAGIYHDSFRVFVIGRTPAVHASIQDRLAAFCVEYHSIPYCTINRAWHLLGAAPEYRQVAIRGSDQSWVDECVVNSVEPDVLIADLKTVTEAALESGTFPDVIRLLLLSHRVSFRYDTLFAQSAALVTESLIAIRRPADALKHAVRYNHLIISIPESLHIVWLLLKHKHRAEARRLLKIIERVCIEGHMRPEMTLETFINITRVHLVATLFLNRDARVGLAIQQHAIDTIRSTVDETKSDLVSNACAGILSIPNSFSFTFSDKYFTNAQIRKHSQSNEIDDDILLKLRVETVLNHLESCETFQLPKERQSSHLLFSDFSELITAGAAVAEHVLTDATDALIRMGATHEVVSQVLGGSKIAVAKGISLRKSNGVDADIQPAYQNGKLWRIEAFINPKTEHSNLRGFDEHGWMATLEELFRAIFVMEGKARRARADGNQSLLQEAKEFFRLRLLPDMKIALGDRIRWDRSYAIPESTLPLLLEVLTEAVIDCFPEELPNFLDTLRDRSLDQMGLYTEGYRECIFRVVEFCSRGKLTSEIVDRLFKLLQIVTDHVVVGVENRHEVVPELLRLITLFARIGASEEAERTYRKVLSLSMGPNWYKEDQFGLMISSLKAVPIESDVLHILPQIAGYLDRASGEMTFQRYVRDDKASFIGAMAARGLVRQAREYFTSQSCGSSDQLFRELSASSIDSPDPKHGGHRPGGAIEEQNAALELIQNSTGCRWYLRWALLEIFQFGDWRHITPYALEYAKIVNENASDSSALAEMTLRMSTVVSTDVPLGRRAEFIDVFRTNLDEDPRDSFAALFTQCAGAPTYRSHIPEIQEDESEEGGRAREEFHERFFLPGLFGKQSALPVAQALLEEARAEVRLENRESAKQKCIAVLKAIQDGEWPIWDRQGNETEFAHRLLQELATSASELSRLYGHLINSERHAEDWRIAEHLILHAGPLLTANESQMVLETVLDHIKQMVGEAPKEIAEFDFLREHSNVDGQQEDLFQFILSLTDHPDRIRREKAAEAALWVALTFPEVISEVARAAFTTTVGFAADVACGILEIASYEDPLGTWRHIQQAIDFEATLSENRHLSRLAALRRLAIRAFENGMTEAKVVGARIDNLFRAGNIALPFCEGRRIPTWARCAQRQWRELERLEVASNGLLDDWSRKLAEICEPHGIEEVFELEEAVSETFRVPAHWPLNRWTSKVLFALNCALFDYVSVDELEAVEEVLRIYNPNAPCRTREAFFPSRFGAFKKSIQGESDYSDVLSDENYLLHYSEIAEDSSGGDGDPRLVHLEVTAVSVPASMRRRSIFLPELTQGFSPRQRECLLDHLDHETVTFVNFEHNQLFFGGFTPATPLPDFLKRINATENDCVRSNWKNDRCEMFDYFGRSVSEGCALSISKAAVRLTDGEKLAWIIKVNEEEVAMVDAANNELY